MVTVQAKYGDVDTDDDVDVESSSTEDEDAEVIEACKCHVVSC